MSEKLPSVSDQIELYKHVLSAANGRPVYFRTLDLGGDKLLPNLNDAREENPALGWRSIRFALDRPGLFRRQLRALLRAADGLPLAVMFPMVTSAHEFRQAKQMLQDELTWGQGRGFNGPSDLKIGAMLETPAFAYALEDIADEVDFVSIGTNDMLQFFHAADRMTPLVSERYPFVSRPVMRFLAQVFETCERLGVPVSICGEGAGRPLEALCLIGLGYRVGGLEIDAAKFLPQSRPRLFIVGVRQDIHARMETTGDLDVAHMFRKTTGTPAETDAGTDLNVSSTAYDGDALVLEDDPNTATDWDAADLDSYEHGVRNDG